MIYVINIFYCNDSSFVLKCSIRNKFCILVVASNIFVIFTPKLGEDEPILTFIFFKGVERFNHQPDYIISRFLCSCAFSSQEATQIRAMTAVIESEYEKQIKAEKFVGKTMYTLGMGDNQPPKKHIYIYIHLKNHVGIGVWAV